jgi:release factor glutamine methyltransferase
MRLPRFFYKTFWLPFYRAYALRHIRKDRVWHTHGLRLHVPTGVFHPGIFLSTPIFLDFLKNIDLQGVTVVDIGTGSGVIALFAAKKGAIATALDIHPLAVATARRNADWNNLPLECLQSDLFSNLPPSSFQYVLANPPYYPLKPKNDTEKAFYAGENLEYFERFFKEVVPFINAQSRIWMILSEDCDWERIADWAAQAGFFAKKINEKRHWGECIFVGEFVLVKDQR